MEQNFYQKHQQVAEDIRLVWKNCKAYNQVSENYGSRASCAMYSVK